jgi:hypothetical protein
MKFPILMLKGTSKNSFFEALKFDLLF